MNYRLHKNTVEAVAKTLEEIFLAGRYADKAVEWVLKSNPRWGSRDRAFIAETTYNIVRYFRFYSYLTQSQEIKRVLGAYLVHNYPELPPWFAEPIEPLVFKQRLQEASQFRHIIQSVPDWMDKLLCDQLGEEVWEQQLSALNQPADLWIRVNTLKIAVHELKKLLPSPTQGSAEAECALKISDRKINFFGLPSFKEGLFEVQDLSSQLVAPFLEVEPGMRVIDACAGAGGKSLHLAALMQNKGRIISLDTEQWKLDELRRRARRAAVSLIETRTIEPKTIKRLYGTADRLLLDVPCSGLGVLRRNPDAKWKLSADFVERIQKTQSEILENYSLMVKPGGKMVYSTCSILPSENQKQVESFLSKNQNFKFLQSQTILPTTFNSDGFFMCLMERVL